MHDLILPQASKADVSACCERRLPAQCYDAALQLKEHPPLRQHHPLAIYSVSLLLAIGDTVLEVEKNLRFGLVPFHLHTPLRSVAYPRDWDGLFSEYYGMK